jgi:hypothetical protein
MEFISSSIAKAWARGGGEYRGILQSPGSTGGSGDESSGRVDAAHFDAAEGAYSFVQSCEECTSKVSASRRVARVLLGNVLENAWKKLSRRNKDCFVGQSVVFSLISAAHTSADDIEQQGSRTACLDR